MSCESDASAARSSIDENLLRRAWLRVGLDPLLPEDRRSYRPDDAVLASPALEPVLTEVSRALFEWDALLAHSPWAPRQPVGVTDPARPEP